MWSLLLIPAAMVVGAILTQPEPPLPPPPADTIILLPNEDGSVGALQVSGPGGEQTLDSAYQAVDVDQAGGFATRTESAASIDAQFGALLDAVPQPPRSFTVIFVSGSAGELTEESQQELAAMREYLLSLPAPEIQVIGHTDRVGSLEDNDRLSRSRAETVKRSIENAGVTAVNIDASGRGEREPLVDTNDGVAEPRNRRVEIRVR